VLWEERVSWFAENVLKPLSFTKEDLVQTTTIIYERINTLLKYETGSKFEGTITIIRPSENPVPVSDDDSELGKVRSSQKVILISIHQILLILSLRYYYPDLCSYFNLEPLNVRRNSKDGLGNRVKFSYLLKKK